MKNFIATFSFLAAVNVFAQPVTLSPAIVTQNDTVTITYDATQGNAALVGVSPVYMHTGVITNLSTSPTDWRHVQGNWGTPDANVLMTNIGGNQHQKTIHINSYYNVPANETVLSLAFVFRNANGSIVGRAVGGGDIFVPISQGGYTAFFNTHPFRQYIHEQGDTMNLEMVASAPSTLELWLDGTMLASGNNITSLPYALPVDNYTTGFHTLVMKADNGTQVVYDTTTYLYHFGVPIVPLPSYAEEGIKVLNDSTMYFQVRAPFKEWAYIKGDFSDWYLKEAYKMNKTPNGEFFWAEITGLDKTVEYGFQYDIGSVGNHISIADPYSEKILDPWNDQYIQDTTYPNLKPYPFGKTLEPVGVFQIEEPAYTWDNSYTYNRPATEELVIYELLIRDFGAGHSYDAVIKKLDYLAWLGVNAIQLMPIMEFEGNESWGYNPMFMMAPDKYYGPKNEFKRFVDSCHARGMAVILDIALNHQFGQSPLVRLFFDGALGQPTAQSPWFNQTPKHDFNVGYDFNHNSAATKYFTKKVIKHWVDEYKIDGYRFDLSKGFTQNNTLGNVGAWGQYDQSRVDIWNDYATHLRNTDPDLYIILEHFADNAEESALSAMGMMLWGNMNHAYNEATMGYPSNLTGVSHQSRNWPDMHLIGYMESHDEERLMYKTRLFGNSNTGYDTRVLDTALQRVALASVFFYTIPGPKMLWQFGELGYDFSINHCPDGTVNNACRTSNKPIRWDYYTQQNRKQLFNVTGELNSLRKKYPVFSYDKQHDLSLSGMTKRIRLSDTSMQVVVLGNFDVIPKTIVPNFHQTGMWYEHFTQDSLMVNNVADPITLQPGAYKLYTTVKTTKSAIDIAEQDIKTATAYAVAHPTAFQESVTFTILSDQTADGIITVLDVTGNVVMEQNISLQKGVSQYVEWQIGPGSLAAGIYVYHINAGDKSYYGKLVKY